jgi:hypothetical protein
MSPKNLKQLVDTWFTDYGKDCLLDGRDEVLQAADPFEGDISTYNSQTFNFVVRGEHFEFNFREDRLAWLAYAPSLHGGLRLAKDRLVHFTDEGTRRLREAIRVVFLRAANSIPMGGK